MILLDANILLYSYNATAPEHGGCRQWLERTVTSGEHVLLPWAVVTAFVRIGTNARVFQTPLSTGEAIKIVESLIDQPSVSLVNPGDRHWQILTGLIRDSQVRGAMIMDAHLAALALEHGAMLCTTDQDFRRFRGLKLINPLEA